MIVNLYYDFQWFVAVLCLPLPSVLCHCRWADWNGIWPVKCVYNINMVSDFYSCCMYVCTGVHYCLPILKDTCIFNSYSVLIVLATNWNICSDWPRVSHMTLGMFMYWIIPIHQCRYVASNILHYQPFNICNAVKTYHSYLHTNVALKPPFDTAHCYDSAVLVGKQGTLQMVR